MAIHPRVIPCLLLLNRGLVKTIQFKKPTYLGDPINVVKIFNEKEVDEIIFLDVTATIENRKPLFDYLVDITSECFMPFCYGGGIRSMQDIKTVLGLGVEKVSINSCAVENPSFIRQAAERFGTQSIIVSIDVKKNIFGKYEVFTHGGRRNTHLDPVKLAMQVAKMGAGEILLNSVDRDCMMKGYDLELIQRVSKIIEIPVVAGGGGGSIQHLVDAVCRGGASAVAAGSMFVYQGQNRAVLINYPNPADLQKAFTFPCT